MFSSRGTSPIVRSKGLTPATKRAVQTSLGRRSPVNPVTDTNYHAVSVRRGDLPVGQAPIPVVPPGQSVPRLNQGYNYPVKMASDYVKQGYQSFRHPIRRLTASNQQMAFPLGGKPAFRFIGKGAEENAAKLIRAHMSMSDYGESKLPVGPNSLRPVPMSQAGPGLTTTARLHGGEVMGISPTGVGMGGGYHPSPGGYRNQAPSWMGLWRDHGMSRNPGKNVHLPTPQPKEFPPTGPDGFYDHEVGPYPDSPLASRKAPREIDDMPDNARNIIHEGGGRPSYESSSPHANDFNNALNELTNGTNADLSARIARNKAFIAKQRLMSSGKSEFNPLEPHAPKNTTMPNNPASRPYEPAKTPSSYMRKMVDAQMGTKPVHDLYDLWDMEAMSGGNYKPAPTGEPRGGHKNPLFGEPEYDKGFAQAYDQRGSRQKIFRDVSKNKQLSRVMFNYLLKNRN